MRCLVQWTTCFSKSQFCRCDIHASKTEIKKKHHAISHGIFLGGEPLSPKNQWRFCLWNWNPGRKVGCSSSTPLQPQVAILRLSSSTNIQQPYNVQKHHIIHAIGMNSGLITWGTTGFNRMIFAMFCTYPPSTSNPIHPIHHHTPMFGHPDIIRLCEIFAQHEVREVESFRNSHWGAIVIHPRLDIIEDLPLRSWVVVGCTFTVIIG